MSEKTIMHSSPVFARNSANTSSSWMGKKKEIIRLERESVIPIFKPKLIKILVELIGDDESAKNEFLKFCKRVECTIRAWYHLDFEEMMQLYAMFEPAYGSDRLKQQDFSPEEIDDLELDFLRHIFKVMDKSNFKLTTDAEIEIAQSGQYRLHLPVSVDESKIDKRLLRRFFSRYPREHLPAFADKYIIFRRGFGIDQLTAYFIMPKVNMILRRFFRGFMKITGLKRLIYGKKKVPDVKDDKKIDDLSIDIEQGEDLFVERIRIEKLGLRVSELFKKNTIQEPTFDRIIVVYRREAIEEDEEAERGIHIKHFKHIPMADMEIVLPEKENPTLTPTDWVKFIVSALIGLVTVIKTITMKKKANLYIIGVILFAVVSYFVKTYLTFQSNMQSYQSLITQSVYDKQLDSGRGTLLHLCDEVILQEVKEVIISYFMLIREGKANRKELDLRCEDMIKVQFGEKCNFDVDDAVQKLEKLGLVSQDGDGSYSPVSLREANEILGVTTEEVVLRARKEAPPALR